MATSHMVTVSIDATDPQDGFVYRDWKVTASSHDFTVAWWLGEPVITEVIEPCRCGDPHVTVTTSSSPLVGVS